MIKCPHCGKHYIAAGQKPFDEAVKKAEQVGAKLAFGKYQGQTFYSVAESDPKYLKWIYNNMNLNADTQKNIETALLAAGEDL